MRPPLNVLIVYDDLYETQFVTAAFDPNPGATALRPVQIEKVRAAELAARYNGNLQKFATIFVLNVKRLEEADWNALTRYVHEGGGLVVAAGASCRPGKLQSADGHAASTGSACRGTHRPIRRLS